MIFIMCIVPSSQNCLQFLFSTLWWQSQDMGQRSLGHMTCGVCGMVYTSGLEDDTREHRKFHYRYLTGITFNVRTHSWTLHKDPCIYMCMKKLMLEPSILGQCCFELVTCTCVHVCVASAWESAFINCLAYMHMYIPRLRQIGANGIHPHNFPEQ